MPIISGSVFFDSTLSGTGTVAIANVPVVLQDRISGNGLAVLTNTSGAFQFDSVPNGSYRLVESWGYSEITPIATPGNFDNAVPILVPTGKDPDVSAITSPPTNTNRIESVSPNTLLLTVTANITNNVFRDGPYTNKPMTVQDVTYVGGNIITAADTGIWGTLPAGTAVDTRPSSEPYPGVVPGFTYINSGNPADGSYTVTNITNFFGQGFIADHTVGDETGRYQMVNGANPGNLFFTQQVPVMPNSFYQFSAWMINLTAGNLPALGYEIRTLSNTVLFSENAAGVAFTSPRTWLELGTFFNTGNNTALNVNLVSRGAAGGGNDYAIDDISLIQATIDDILTAEKFTNKDFANIGDVIDYTIVLNNTGNSSITNLVIVDTIPSGTTFNSGTLQVNGTTVPSTNPSSFNIPTPPIPMIPGEVITVTYKVTVNTIPSPNPIPNSATANYAFAPINGGTTVPNAVATNTVFTQINNGDITARKLVDKNFVQIGDIVTYTIPIANIGNTTTNNIVLIDTIPTGTTFVTDSLTIDGVTQAGISPAPATGASIGTIPAGTVSTISFKVLVNTIPSPNPFINNASFNYNFLVDPVTVTFRNSGVNTNSVSTKVNTAIVTEVKSVNKAFANINDILIYTVVLKNSGNTTATSVTFIDTIPNDTTFVSNSVTVNGVTISGVTPDPPGFTIGTIPSGTTVTVTFNVTVNTIPTPNPIPNTSTGDYSFTIDPSVPNGGSGNLNSNTVNTQINNASLGNIEKLVDKTFATCKDVLNYTILLPNNGNTTAFNVILKDTLPNGTTFVTNSVTVNGVTQTGANPSLGVTIPSIAPGATATLTFQATVQC